MIIARLIRSGYNLIKAWKRLASAKTLQTHFNNRIIYSQKWYFTTSKLLRSTIPKNESLYHTFRKRPQNKSTNNYSIFSTSTKSTINYRKKKQHRNGSSLTRQTTLFSIFRSLFGPLSRALSESLSARALWAKKIPSPYIQTTKQSGERSNEIT